MISLISLESAICHFERPLTVIVYSEVTTSKRYYASCVEIDYFSEGESYRKSVDNFIVGFHQTVHESMKTGIQYKELMKRMDRKNLPSARIDADRFYDAVGSNRFSSEIATLGIGLSVDPDSTVFFRINFVLALEAVKDSELDEESVNHILGE